MNTAKQAYRKEPLDFNRAVFKGETEKYIVGKKVEKRLSRYLPSLIAGSIAINMILALTPKEVDYFDFLGFGLRWALIIGTSLGLYKLQKNAIAKNK